MLLQHQSEVLPASKVNKIIGLIIDLDTVLLDCQRNSKVSVGLTLQFEIVGVNFDFLRRYVKDNRRFDIFNINDLASLAFVLALNDSNKVTWLKIFSDHADIDSQCFDKSRNANSREVELVVFN